MVIEFQLKWLNRLGVKRPQVQILSSRIAEQNESQHFAANCFAWQCN